MNTQSSIDESTVENGIRIAHQLRELRMTKPNFDRYLSDEQRQDIEWVVGNFPTDIQIQIPNNFKNNYGTAYEAAVTLIPIIKHLKEKREPQTKTSMPISSPIAANVTNLTSTPKTFSENQVTEIVDALRKDMLKNTNNPVSNLVLDPASVSTSVPPSAAVFNSSTGPQNSVTLTSTQFAQLMTALKLNPARADYTPTHNDTSFRPQDLGIFEPNYNAKSPTGFQDGKTIYHDVFSFTARVKAITELKSSGPWSPLNVATKLDLCLRGDAETWYTNELSPVTRAGLATNLEFWCTALEKRFQQSPTVALDKLERSRYTIQDARAQRSPEQFVQNLIVLGKNAGTISSEYAQILTAYKHIDAPLRLAWPKPTITTSISDFMSNVTDAKEIWFDMYQHNNNPSKPDWKSHKHRMTDFKSSSSEEPNMRSQNQDKPRDRFKPPSHQFKSIGRFDNRQSNTPHRINTAQNYTADIQSRQIQDENQDAQNETLDSYDEVYFQEMDSLSDEDDKPSSKDHQEDAGWLHPMHSYHLSHSAIAKLPFEQSSAVKQQNITASDPSKNITCNICDTKFPSRNKLHHHIKSLHKKSKNSRSNLALHSSNPFTKDLAKIQSIHEGSNNEEILPISTLQLVASNAPKSAFPPGYGFRGRRYAQVQVILHSPANNPTWVCIDSGCTMTLIDKNFLIKECPTINLAKMPSAMTVRGIGAQFHDASKFALKDLFFPDGKGNAGHISRELHVVDDLPAKILIGIDIMLRSKYSVRVSCISANLPEIVLS
ncbi:hypothetical protein HI914_06545 [Erysiphe necator]|nr:hypothetical protein HI914_06545 [Erysiphe necator]